MHQSLPCLVTSHSEFFFINYLGVGPRVGAKLDGFGVENAFFAEAKKGPLKQ